jgi:predicted nucleic acid-binding protein
MKRFLLDTNHLGEAMIRVSIVRDRIQPLHRQGDVFGTCGPVLCELMVGLSVRKDSDACLNRLNNLLSIIRLWPLDLAIASQYAGAYHELKKAGRALSQVDIILAAMARQLNGTLLTTDQDFQAFPDIQTENWLAR